MKFKQFMVNQMEGLFGSPKKVGELGLIKTQSQAVRPVSNKGTSVGRMMSAGKVKSPARPVGLVSFNKPMTLQSNL